MTKASLYNFIKGKNITCDVVWCTYFQGNYAKNRWG